MSELFAFERIDEFNARVAEWAARLKAAARSSVSAKTRQNTRLSRSIKVNLIKERGTGQVYRVRVSFEKEGVYVHVGAGRGYGGFKGGTFYSEAQGKRVKVKETSIGKMGTGARPAVPWLSPQIEAMMPELADIAKEYSINAWVKSKGFSVTVKL